MDECGQCLDGREFFKQLPKSDLHPEALLQRQRGLREAERIKAQLEQRRTWLELFDGETGEPMEHRLDRGDRLANRLRRLLRSGRGLRRQSWRSLRNRIDPVAFALERIRGQLHSQPPLAEVQAAPIDVQTRHPQPAERLQHRGALGPVRAAQRGQDYAAATRLAGQRCERGAGPDFEEKVVRWHAGNCSGETHRLAQLARPVFGRGKISRRVAGQSRVDRQARRLKAHGAS